MSELDNNHTSPLPRPHPMPAPTPVARLFGSNLNKDVLSGKSCRLRPMASLTASNGKGSSQICTEASYGRNDTAIVNFGGIVRNSHDPSDGGEDTVQSCDERNQVGKDTDSMFFTNICEGTQNLTRMIIVIMYFVFVLYR